MQNGDQLSIEPGMGCNGGLVWFRSPLLDGPGQKKGEGQQIALLVPAAITSILVAQRAYRQSPKANEPPHELDGIELLTSEFCADWLRIRKISIVEPGA